MAEATVEEVDVREIRGRHSHYFLAELGYSYAVNAEYFSGHFRRDFALESDAWDYANRTRGTKAIVRYHPEHPDHSKLDTATGASRHSC